MTQPAAVAASTAAIAAVAPDELVTGEAVALDVRPAGFLLRALSGVIDFAVGIAALMGLIALAVWAGSGLDAAAQSALTIASLVLALVVLPIAVEVASHGRSLGRLVIGARVVRDDGGAAGFRHAFIRALSGVVEVYLTLGGLAVLVAILSPRSKRLGDLLAGTYAQHERPPHWHPPAVTAPPALAQWAELADVAALPDPLARRIAAFLAQQDRLADASRAALATQLAAEAAPYVRPLPQVDAVTFLAGVGVVRHARERRALDAEAQRLASLTPTLTRLPHGFPER